MFDVTSKLLMLAWAPNDAWAFFKTLTDHRFWMIRTNQALSEITFNSIGIAIAKFGFEPHEMEFDDLEKLKAYLSKTYISRHRAKGNTLESDDENARNLVRHAPLEIVLRYLEQIETELIPNAEFDAAKGLLQDLLDKNPVVLKSPELQARIKSLMAKCP